MALTVQKRHFAELIESGVKQVDAAIAAGYSEKTADVKASQLMRDPDVLNHISKLKQDRNDLATKLNADPTKENYKFKTGKDFLLHIMNDPMAEDKIRTDAAKALYAAERAIDQGKKAMEQKKGEQTAQQSSRFGALAAPPTTRPH